jgi:5-oxoprolinase (ATP-hydrolysing) subunit C
MVAMSLRILDPGLLTLVVDAGRPHTRSLGVPLGGAADRLSFALGNALVGNPPEAAALEITLSGPRLQADCELACVLFGAPFEIHSDRQQLESGTTFTLEAGEELRIGTAIQGMRAYFCIRGGIQSKPILESRSSLAPLQAGAELPCLPGTVGHRFIRTNLLARQDANRLRVLSGPQRDWFPGDLFFQQPYRVTPASNRMGLRLAADPLPFPARELVSEPVAPGAVQVTSNGQCIVLGVEGQTIGGYPKIAQVIAADLHKLSQLRPDENIRFIEVNLAEAERLFREQENQLQEWVTRLLVSGT